jgi:hypothetical protein
MLGNLLGLEAPKIADEIDTKKPRVSPWDIINAINDHKTDLVNEDNEAQCKKEAYYVFRALSMGADTVIYANEMNARYHLDFQLQFDFLINTIRPRKRYNKWLKSETIDVLDDVCEYYGYSMAKARQVLPLLTLEQLVLIKQKLHKGGKA